MDLIFWSVRSPKRRGGGGLKVGMEDIVSSLIIREHENLVQHPRNNISITVRQVFHHFINDHLLFIFFVYFEKFLI